jgi:hypothetical protein
MGRLDSLSQELLVYNIVGWAEHREAQHAGGSISQKLLGFATLSPTYVFSPFCHSREGCDHSTSVIPAQAGIYSL